MRTYAILIFLLLAGTAYSQKTINNYKYILVPDRYDFFKMDNQYGLNTLTKFLLQEKGFTAVMSSEQMPAEMAANPCNALRTEVVQKKGLFVTNLTLLLKDCQGNIIFKSKEGKSREKEYQVAYEFALRDAFSSLNDIPYKYDSVSLAPPQPVAAVQPASPATAVPAPPPPPAPATAAITETTGILYAQATANGYQLIDITPKKVLTLLKTSMPDYFITEGGAYNGVVFKNNGEWFYEYYKDNKLVSQKLQIKF
ncbi:hypothetical protein [Chitinophaga ginsengisoli]|uniref:Uncharacterized protein n=1 Tax=Chitinophaga ginsengisoli TaxID=363837 RepID=A0A2P8FVX1_9BACT|nr:hypothetical protein [Chitinophaga ginsengisoli]PSL25873.1 hypothetical protein CLV42_11278 [Chitinophaga ginsengisoli]